MKEFDDKQYYQGPPFNPVLTHPHWRMNHEFDIPVVSSVGNGPKGDKGDPLVFDDLTDEQMQKVLQDANYVGNKAEEATYITGSGTTMVIEIPIADFDQFDMLFVDIEGLDLHEGADYDIVGNNIILNTPITHSGAKVHFKALSYTLIDGNKTIQNIMGHHDYDTVATMKLDTDIELGAICHTLGFNAKGDKGAAWYKVTDDAIATETDVISLDNGYYAIMYKDDESVNPEMLGVFDYTLTEWAGTTQSYSKRTVVYWGSSAYTARQDVPTGIQITNEEYWVPWVGNEALRLELELVNAALPISEFSAENTVKKYVDDAKNELQTNIDDLKAFNVNPTVSYEGIINTGEYNLGPAVLLSANRVLQILYRGSSDTIYKIYQILSNEENKLISYGALTGVGAVNSACRVENSLYTIGGGNVNVYSLPTYELADSFTLDSNFQGIYYDDATDKIYVTQNSGNNFSLYELVDNVPVLVKENLLPSNYAASDILRNDGTIDNGYLFVSLTNYGGAKRYNNVFVYDISDDKYTFIEMPIESFAFKIEEVEGFSILDGIGFVSFISTQNIKAFGTFPVYANGETSVKAQGGIPALATGIRLATIDETESIYLIGSASNPMPDLPTAALVNRYYDQHFYGKTYVNAQEDIEIGAIPAFLEYLEMNNHKITFTQNIAIGNGVNSLAIMDAVFEMGTYTFTGSRTARLYMYGIDLGGGTINVGRNIAILANVTNGTINTQSGGSADLIFKVGTTQ